jgi:hypothetical protein
MSAATIHGAFLFHGVFLFGSASVTLAIDLLRRVAYYQIVHKNGALIVSTILVAITVVQWRVPRPPRLQRRSAAWSEAKEPQATLIRAA